MEISFQDYFKEGYVLVVDDQLNMRRTIKTLLHYLEIDNVVEAGDGIAALAILRETLKSGSERRILVDPKDESLQILLDNQIIKMAAKKVNMAKCLFVLLDWNMPRLSGIDVAREVRSDRELRDLPILMITAEKELGQVSQAGEIGVNGYLVKPFDAVKLKETMLSIMKNRERPPKHVEKIIEGEKLMEENKFDKALLAFEESRKTKDTARVNVLIGELHERSGKDELAIAHYVAAANRNPTFLPAQVAAANLLLKKNDRKAALFHLEKACDISPNNIERHVLAGEIHIENGNDHAAEKIFQTACKRDKKAAAAVGEALFKAGKQMKAEQYFRDALRVGAGDSVHIHNRLGIILRGKGKWQEAIEEYKKALKLDPGDEILYYNLGKAYLQGGKRYDAIESFQAALKLKPDFGQAREELGKL